MKKKINITMQVTYEVTKEVEVDSEILESLQHIQEYYPNRVDAYIAEIDDDVCDGYDWIVDNCKEKDACDWDVEIQDLIVEK